MKKRFVLATNATTTQEDQAFKDRLSKEYPGIGWWHRMDELWLIADESGRFDAKQLRELAKECFLRKKILVLQIDATGDTWSGTGIPGTNGKETFGWLHLNWDDD